MDGSSCITCHARAGIHVDEKGKGYTFFKLGVFENSLSSRLLRGPSPRSWHQAGKRHLKSATHRLRFTLGDP